MSKLEFNSSPKPTLGVEIEVALVDNKSMALSSSIHEVLARLPEELQNSVKPELMQCYLEINTDICDDVSQVEADLRKKILGVQTATDELDLLLLWSATHPFSRWAEQHLVETERYKMLLELLQDTARQLITFGLHVHVGIDTGDKAVMICDRIMQHLPTLLALSSNSPFWEGRLTGLQSNRVKIMEGLPTAGLPSLMRNWSEYTWLVNHLIETGFINSIREIWWDVRPHNNFGTVEIRICDMPGRLEDVLALTALIQSLVVALSAEIDEGTYQHDCHPMMVRQNKWRACRFGMDAKLVDSYTHEVRTAREQVEHLVTLLTPTARDLGCKKYLEHALSMTSQPSGAGRQVEIMQDSGDPVEVVRKSCTASRLH